MFDRICPANFQELAQVCQERQQLLPCGGRTKPGLLTEAARGQPLTLVDMRQLCGIVSYDPSEFLISARAGTSITELSAALAEQGQYLPFDPVLADSGATLGGSIASGISGSCRLLYGSLRDFMLEVQLCDSAGREVRGGGKVVKNAAGFDLPKLVVGSYGRLGIITEATLKVFPQPAGSITLRITAPFRSAIEITTRLQALPLPIAAVDVDWQANGPSQILVRLSGPIDSLRGMAARVIAALPTRGAVQCIDHSSDEADLWRARAQFQWCHAAAALVRVALVHHQCLDLGQALAQLSTGFQLVLSCGATVAWIATESLDQLAPLDQLLGEQKLAAVVVRGPGQLTLLGDRRWVAGAERIQQALDPAGKWLAFQGCHALPG